MTNQSPPDNEPYQLISETEQVLQDILVSYRSELIAAIRAGDHEAVAHYAAFIAYLTGRSVHGPEIPDLPVKLHVTAKTGPHGT